jgi:hypothetical protein
MFAIEGRKIGERLAVVCSAACIVLAGCLADPDAATEDETTESSSALVTLAAPVLTYIGSGEYSDRMGAWLTLVDVADLNVSGVTCPSGKCDYTVYRRTRTSLTGGLTTSALFTIYRSNAANNRAWSRSVKPQGSTRFEYWVVASDGANTSPPSNIIVMNRCENLFDDELLYENNPIFSCDLKNRLYPQGDGNLVLSKYSSTTRDYTIAKWVTGPKTGANRLYMQADGNLVYSAQPADVAKWTTRTYSTSSHDNTNAQMTLWGTDHFSLWKPDPNNPGVGIDLWDSDTGRAY